MKVTKESDPRKFTVRFKAGAVGGFHTKTFLISKKSKIFWMKKFKDFDEFFFLIIWFLRYVARMYPNN